MKSMKFKIMNTIYQIWVANTILIIFIIWFLLGIAGFSIYNHILKYDCISTKITWNILVFLCGGLGFLCSVLTWIRPWLWGLGNMQSKNKN